MPRAQETQPPCLKKETGHFLFWDKEKRRGVRMNDWRDTFHVGKQGVIWAVSHVRRDESGWHWSRWRWQMKHIFWEWGSGDGIGAERVAEVVWVSTSQVRRAISYTQDPDRISNKRPFVKDSVPDAMWSPPFLWTEAERGTTSARAQHGDPGLQRAEGANCLISRREGTRTWQRDNRESTSIFLTA